MRQITEAVRRKGPLLGFLVLATLIFAPLLINVLRSKLHDAKSTASTDEEDTGSEDTVRQDEEDPVAENVVAKNEEELVLLAEERNEEEYHTAESKDDADSASEDEIHEEKKQLDLKDILREGYSVSTADIDDSARMAVERPLPAIVDLTQPPEVPPTIAEETSDENQELAKKKKGKSTPLAKRLWQRRKKSLRKEAKKEFGREPREEGEMSASTLNNALGSGPLNSASSLASRGVSNRIKGMISSGKKGGFTGSSGSGGSFRNKSANPFKYGGVNGGTRASKKEALIAVGVLLGILAIIAAVIFVGLYIVRRRRARSIAANQTGGVYGTYPSTGRDLEENSSEGQESWGYDLNTRTVYPLSTGVTAPEYAHFDDEQVRYTGNNEDAPVWSYSGNTLTGDATYQTATEDKIIYAGSDASDQKAPTVDVDLSFGESLDLGTVADTQGGVVRPEAAHLS
ncbi:hypothetical protein Dda_8679 [Drechslerella dactyloides]|uniref:Uncharacterized protein n=1 Tax=Drechslerella dactyloides TaxID=74499 RepID=A0AAD6NEY2_DREDA|nr:hypothetical protein Dda_8679 [Drechslerella dactyloides]